MSTCEYREKDPVFKQRMSPDDAAFHKGACAYLLWITNP